MGPNFRNLKVRRSLRPYGILGIFVMLALGGMIWSAGSASAAAPAPQAASSASQAALPPAPSTPDELLAAFRRTEVASISDAEEKILGKKMYMSHDMRPLFPTKFAGFALTLELKPQEGAPSTALGGMLRTLDSAKPNDVFVMVVPNGLNYAGAGGEMGTTLWSRGVVGAIIDGGVRDTSYLQQIRFPVFARSIVPSTTVGHYAFADANVPVVCAGVTVNPQDVIVADNDGVVVVPRSRAQEVLKAAQEMDFAEHSTDAYISKYKSIEEAVKQFGRL